MLKARWSGYEIDSSEAAYEVKVAQPEKLGTLLRGLLTSGYFVKSYYSLFVEPLQRLRDFIKEHGDPQDKLAAQALTQLDKHLEKFDPTSHRAPRIGVRAIEAILNYVGVHRRELLDAQVFRFDLMDWQKEMYEDYGYDEEFEPGSLVEESQYYSEEEIPFDGVVLYLGCSLVAVDRLSPREAKAAYNATLRSYKESGLLNELAGWSLGPSRDYVMEDISRPKDLSLRVRMNPDASFTITGRWMDDGQFIFPYYDYLLGLAAKKAGVKIGTYCL